MQKYVYNFTHNDLDGIGCYVVLKVCLNKKASVTGYFCSYKNINEKVKEFIEQKKYLNYVKVIISDISVNEEVAEMIDNLKPNNFILFDHHKTALELNKYEWCNVSVENKEGLKNAGTNLIYDYVKNTDINIDNFVELVRSYDTWDWEKENNIKAKDLNNIFQMLGMFDFANFYSNSIIEKSKFEVDDLHKKMLYYKKKEIELYIQRKEKDIKFLLDKNNNKFAFIFADYNISELANDILNKNDVKYVIVFYGSGFSLRAKEDFDISEICKANGGGGHKNAGAFNIDYDWYKDILDKIKYPYTNMEFVDFGYNELVEQKHENGTTD
jgi:oligoribonuclease NrnB/cAMP/cGMP phosphodiesterase (DHH superfamily)